jgi:hypothetical protein
VVGSWIFLIDFWKPSNFLAARLRTPALVLILPKHGHEIAGGSLMPQQKRRQVRVCRRCHKFTDMARRRNCKGPRHSGQVGSCRQLQYKAKSVDKHDLSDLLKFYSKSHNSWWNWHNSFSEIRIYEIDDFPVTSTFHGQSISPGCGIHRSESTEPGRRHDQSDVLHPARPKWLAKGPSKSQ